ncbi:MAG: site-specific DNA-methyltransferase, partial [Candidatus Omnitrophica bacterium]|nr:site-specific DNA-methyltransferase [Candidatus Omnitrophota bacterium]
RTERAIAGFRAYCRKHVPNSQHRLLLDFACFSILETVSYTRKDGQYLRWDYRSGRERVRGTFDKGKIGDFDPTLRSKLESIHSDMLSRRAPGMDTLFPTKEEHSRLGTIELREGSCLEILPMFPTGSVSLVFTSPPYCNRYDYTRTYALELVYLGLDDQKVKDLRQTMLSCTVENREKVLQLQGIYGRMNREREFSRIQHVFREQAALQEVLSILDEIGTIGKLNNSNIPRMVRNYFLEMAVVIHELARVLKPGGRVVMVNDNVRYAGEEVPVDLILSDFAVQFGLSVRHIWTLPSGKGNSSQQMGMHGRNELRKCVYVWEKP